MVTYRHTWGEHRVYYNDQAGHLQQFPASWTDALAPDPFVVVADGRSVFRFDDLLRLVELIERLKP